MKKQPSFKLPVSITDPEKIINCLSDEQHTALAQYIGQGTSEYYRSMMDELARVEEELQRASALISRQRAAMRNLMANVPLVRLRSGIDLKSGMN